MARVIDIVVGIFIFSIASGLLFFFWTDVGSSYNVEINETYSDYYDIVNNSLAPMHTISSNMSESASADIGFDSFGSIGKLVINALKLPLKALSVTGQLIRATWISMGLPPELAWVFAGILGIITLYLIYALLGMFFGRIS